MTAPQTIRQHDLDQLYADLAGANLNPLWVQLDDLMPMTPTSAARPHVWRWSLLLPLAERSGELVPVGRGGERRAIALANPGLGGLPYVSPTLWAAIQYLGPKRRRPNIATRRTHSASSSRGKAYGRWSTAIRWPCAAAISYSRRGGHSMDTTTKLIARWPGSTDWTSRWLIMLAPDSSNSAPIASVTPAHPIFHALSGFGHTLGYARWWVKAPPAAHRSRVTDGNTPTSLWMSSWRWKPKGIRRHQNPDTQRSATPTPPPAATCSPPSEPSSIACGQARRTGRAAM